jgi:hypothetical protein
MFKPIYHEAFKITLYFVKATTRSLVAFTKTSSQGIVGQGMLMTLRTAALETYKTLPRLGSPRWDSLGLVTCRMRSLNHVR